jgi:hypothetical protein
MIAKRLIGGYDRGHKTPHFTTDASMPQVVANRLYNLLEQHENRHG